MAYIVARGNGAWEIRESHLTKAGPRSRTLATFKTLTPEVVERACQRSCKPLDPADLRRAVRRAGAPIALPPSDQASAELIAELAAGRRPRPALARLLLDALQVGDDALRVGDGRGLDNAQSAAEWITASPQRRGDTLRDLLLLVDRLPRGHSRERERFPRIQSRPA
jgi:hypothetical protein